MACSHCGDSVAAGCVRTDAQPPFNHLSGAELDGLLRSLDDELGILFTRLKTDTLIRRNFTPAQLASLPALLQALIDKTTELDTRPIPGLTSAALLATPLQIPVGCLTDVCSGGQSQTLGQILTGLVTKVCSLQAELAQLRQTSTTFYVP